MNSRIITHPKLNNGQPIEFFYPTTDEEIDNQIEEILELGEYDFEKKEGGAYLDIGANCGMATLYFAQFAKQVYSVEPNPEIYKALVKNTQHLPNVKTFNVAWAEHNMEGFMFSDDENHLPQLMHERNKSRSSILVHCITPEKFFMENKIDHIDVMKIDAEESEYYIFPNLSFGNVTPKIDAIVGEAHFQLAGGFPDIIPDLLKQWGYETTFPELKKPNYLRTYTYYNPNENRRINVSVPYNTIFVAKKVK